MFDHQKIYLVSATEFDPEYREMQEIPDNSEVMAYTARVSNPSNQNNVDTEVKLLNYCIRSAHWSVFEMADVTMEINTTRDIGRQILRHRSACFQEFSQRYADISALEQGFIVREARLQDTKNRQNSIDVEDSNLQSAWDIMQKSVWDRAIHAYKWALDSGIAKEQARVVMPEGMTMSRMFMKNSVRNWFHYCQLRKGHGTQKEHQDIANKCWDLLCAKYPWLLEIDVTVTQEK